MIDQVLDNFRKASESTVQLQQELFKQWTSQWTSAAHDLPGVTPTSRLDPAGTNVPEALARDTYRHDEQASRVARRPVQGGHPGDRRVVPRERGQEPRRLSPHDGGTLAEGLENLKSSTETQIRDFQAAAQKWCELMAKAKV